MCVHVRNIMFALLLQQMSWQIKYTHYEQGAILYTIHLILCAEQNSFQKHVMFVSTAYAPSNMVTK